MHFIYGWLETMFCMPTESRIATIGAPRIDENEHAASAGNLSLKTPILLYRGRGIFQEGESRLWPLRDSATKLAPQPEVWMRIGGSEETLTTNVITGELGKRGLSP